MGRSIPLNGQIPLVGGRTVKVNEKTGVLFDLSPEAEASLAGKGMSSQISNDCTQKLGAKSSLTLTWKNSQSVFGQLVFTGSPPSRLMMLRQ